jgi:hypothetical protein
MNAPRVPDEPWRDHDVHNLRAAPEPAPETGLPPRRLTAAHTAEQIRQTSMFDPNDDAQHGQQTDSHVTDDGALTGPRELISWTNQPGSGHQLSKRVPGIGAVT